MAQRLEPGYRYRIRLQDGRLLEGEARTNSYPSGWVGNEDGTRPIWFTTIFEHFLAPDEIVEATPL